MSEFHQNCPVFFNRVMNLASKVLDGPHCGGVLGMLLDATQPKTVMIRISLMRRSQECPARAAVEVRSKVIVVDPLEPDDAITARIQDAFGKLPEPKFTICVKCENYAGPSLTALRGCPDAALPGPTRCVPYLDNTLDPMTGDRKRGAAVSCNWRNPDGKCKHYSRKEKRTPSNGTRQEEAGSKEEAEQTDREV